MWLSASSTSALAALAPTSQAYSDGYVLGMFLAIALMGALVTGGVLFWLRGEARNKARREALLRLTPDAMGAAIRERVPSIYRWDRLAASAPLLVKRSWTDAELLDALQALYDEALRELPPSLGKDGNAYAFQACGLTSILEVLRARVARSAHAGVAGHPRNGWHAPSPVPDYRRPAT